MTDQPPKDLDASAVTAFLGWLAVEKSVSASTQNQAFSAVLFLYKDVLHVELGAIEHVPRAKESVHIPVVMSVDEVRRVLGQLDGVTLDVQAADGDTWVCSGDRESDASHANVFNNLSGTLACAAGSRLPFNAVSLDKGGFLRYRAYFHVKDGAKLLESPVLDDVTFVFVSNQPIIAYWQTFSD